MRISWHVHSSGISLVIRSFLNLVQTELLFHKTAFIGYDHRQLVFDESAFCKEKLRIRYFPTDLRNSSISWVIMWRYVIGHMATLYNISIWVSLFRTCRKRVLPIHHWVFQCKMSCIKGRYTCSHSTENFYYSMKIISIRRNSIHHFCKSSSTNQLIFVQSFSVSKFTLTITTKISHLCF